MFADPINALILSDLHLTNVPRDHYRWGIFPWALRVVKRKKIEHVFILGDLTDLKDNHPSALVNKLVRYLVTLGELCNVHILMGNHDYRDPSRPFFDFLNYLGHDVTYYKTTEKIRIGGIEIMLAPHTRSPIADYLHGWDSAKVQWVLMHHTFKGAVASNGAKMEGCNTKDVLDAFPNAVFLSGDIHVPQNIGGVEYVGSPYPIRFGDEFDPRCLLVDLMYPHSEHWKDLQYPTIRKVKATISRPNELEILVREGDQVKVVLSPKSREPAVVTGLRRRVAEVCDELGVDLVGITVALPESRKIKRRDESGKPIEGRDDKTVLLEYCTREDLDQDVTDAGITLL